MFKESVRISWFNIIQNKMRSLLTILGIIIGVMSIIALVSVVNGVTGEMNEQFLSLGANKIMVKAPPNIYKEGITLHELEVLSDIKGVSGITPTLSTTSSVVTNQEVFDDVTIEGISEVYFEEVEYALKNGRVLNAVDVLNETEVAVISESLAGEMFPSTDPIAQSLLINGIRFEIVGVLYESENSDMVVMMMGGNKEDIVYIPHTSALKLQGKNAINSFDIFTEEDAFVDQLNDELEMFMNQFYNYDEDAFSIMNMDNLMDTMNEMHDMMLLMLLGITSISLLVGGIGIMNMMLVSVTERTTEIGLRKALGARPSAIQLQFLLESAILSVIGGVVGIFLGVIATYLITSFIGIEPTISAFAVALSIGFSLSVGIIFGYVPAKRASQLNPIEALRST